jgi:hypothetical protein
VLALLSIVTAKSLARGITLINYKTRKYVTDFLDVYSFDRQGSQYRS